MIVAQETNKNRSVGQQQHIIFPTSLHISLGYPRPLVALSVSTGQIFYIECMNISTNCSKFVCQRRFVSLLSGLRWWWRALGGTWTWSRSCFATVPTPHWETRTAGTPSTSPAERETLWSYSTCSLLHQTSGGRRAGHAGRHYTPQVSVLTVCGDVTWGEII